MAKRRIEQGLQTRQALLRAALRVVFRHGFAGASVHRITAACGVAHGSLYTYFDSHAQLLEALLPHEGILMLKALGRSIDHRANHFENERRALIALFRYLQRRPHFLRLLTEAEVAAPVGHREHALRVEQRYIRALRHAHSAGTVRAASDFQYSVVAGVLAAARGYIAIGLCDGSPQRLFRPPPIEPWVVDAYVGFVSQGVGAGVAPPPRRRRRRQPHPPGIEPASLGKRHVAGATSDAILSAAARCIHRDGYAGTSIASICAEAGFAVGTFYGHFPSRQQMFARLLDRVRLRMLDAVDEAARDCASFLEFEAHSFDAFVEHLESDPWLIRIETEAAVWASEDYLRHFRLLTDAHLAAMDRYRLNGDLSGYEDRELSVIAWILMAARHFLATRFMLRGGDTYRLSAPVRRAYLELVSRGLRAS